ncbi:MAG: IS30 family transposase [Lachnospiraceae bacterium]|nr:IS30 family transposase [Lachnospiraceae bacterium]
MKNKHLTLEERIIIEEYLEKGISIHRISLKLGRPDSSIVREIKRNRFRVSLKEKVPCVFRNTENCTVRHLCGDQECNKDCSFCSECGPNCNDYIPKECPKLKKSPFVCNGCNDCLTHKQHCLKYRYSARKADVLYHDNLTSSRVGISLTPEEMEDLDNLVSPLLLQGQSVQAIFFNHKDEIPCSESTLYNYIDQCYLTARNIDMPRKVRYKTRYKHQDRNGKRDQSFTENRKYSDFLQYISDNPDLNIWEMDTVIGSQGGKSLLTLLYRKSTFMIAILLDTHTQESVINALNEICATIGIKKFQKLFQVLLCDRGIEFGNPYALECDENGEIKTKVYYCDPYSSWQKPMVERNHEFIRMVLPKGKSFDNLSQKDIHLMMNHINNYPRESLNERTPYELSKLLLGNDFLQALGYYKIHPDDVILKPMLLQKPKFTE